jgi:signal transduction histidine kinase
MLNSDSGLDASSNRQVITSPSLQYPTILTELTVEQSQVMPIFTEATTLAIRLTRAPVAILMVTSSLGCQIGSVAGLEKFVHLPIDPDLHLELAGLEYCYAQVMSSESKFSITDCQQHPELAQLPLVRLHGVQAYLGLPIVTAAKDRLGTIAILDFKPRQFSERDIDLLQIVSRLVASEFERKLLSQAQLDRSIDRLQLSTIPGFDDPLAAAEYEDSSPSIGKIDHYSLPADLITFDRNLAAQDQVNLIYPQVQGEIQFKLLTHLAQELRTPLTSILGMASVLQQEIYGPLSGKQADYLGIIYQSGQQLVTIVDEISKLSEFDIGEDSLSHRHQHQLAFRSVNLEMLCQLALQSLEPLAQRKNQQLLLDLTKADLCQEKLIDKMYSIDKNKVQQIIYYLCLSLIHASTIDCQILIQICDVSDGLQLQLLTNDPHVILEQLDANQLGAVVAPDRSYPHQPHSTPGSARELGFITQPHLGDSTWRYNCNHC